jgi:malate dehydrogenase (oxaloacetate-decarboxylating)(NADP+)
LGLDNQLIRVIGNKARRDPKRLVFAEADNQKILKAASILYDDGIAYPILLGDPGKINRIAEENNIDITDIPIIDPRSDEMESKREFYSELFFKKRHRKGINKYESLKIMKDRNHFGCMMVETGDAMQCYRAYKKLCRSDSPGFADHWYGGRCEEDCGHVFPAHKKRPFVFGRHNREF